MSDKCFNVWWAEQAKKANFYCRETEQICKGWAFQGAFIFNGTRLDDISQAQAEIAELKKQNEKLAIDYANYRTNWEEYGKLNEQLKEELRLERECVDFYADKVTFLSEMEDFSSYYEGYHPFEETGKRARQRQANRKILTDKDR